MVFCFIRQSTRRSQMKKYFLLLPALLLPYFLIFMLLCFFNDFLREHLLGNNPFIAILMLWLSLSIAFVCNIIFIVLCILKKWNAKGISRANMIIRLIQVPAYIIIFILGFFLLTSPFTMAFSLIFFIFDCISVFIMGLIGLVSVIRCYTVGGCTKTFAVVCGLLQFVFCADVITSIIIFIKARSAAKKDTSYAASTETQNMHPEINNTIQP